MPIGGSASPRMPGRTCSSIQIGWPLAVLDHGFRGRLGARLTHQPRRVWADWLPAAVHFASCGVAMVVCVAVLPDAAGD
jgi:hypothetical protein